MLRIVFYLFALQIYLVQSNFAFGSLAVYIGLFLLTIIFYIAPTKQNFNIEYFLILLVSALSILFNNIPPIFQSELRLVGYSLIFLICTPLFNNDKLYRYRNLLFSSILNICVIGSVLSFLGFLTGIIPRNNPNEVAGGFSGLFVNSVAFGTVCAISFIYILNKTFINRSNKKKVFYYGCLLVLLSVDLLVSGARSALICCFIASSIYIAKFYNFNLIKFVGKNFIILIIFLVFVVTYFLKNRELLDAINNKNELATNNSDIFFSRRNLWNARIDEFSKNPILGIGFSAVEVGNDFKGLHEENSSIEAGSSWLFILSSLGLLGFILFFKILVIKTVRYLFTSISNMDNLLYISLLSFFIIHMFFEGYIFAVSNVVTYILFLSISLLKNDPKNMKPIN